jgi:putative protein-disulfide isomerase
MTNQQQLEILAFTDPVCTWCWGSEPQLRKLLAWYGDQIRVIPVMGGLVEDIRGFYDRANRIGGDPKSSNEQIARHWLEASERHGMPVRIEDFRMFDSEIVSTYPQNIAYKAVELCNPELAARFLRRMREAAAAEARVTGKREVLIELASEVGVDIAAFVGHLDDGSAEKAFRDDLLTTRQYGARGFPTFLLRFDGKEIMLRGYQTFSNLQAVIASLAANLLQAHPPEKTAEALLEFLRVHGRAAPVELTTVFDISPTELDALLQSPAAQQRIRRVPAGNGCFLEPVPEGLSCDSVTGICVREGDSPRGAH